MSTPDFLAQELEEIELLQKYGYKKGSFKKLLNDEVEIILFENVKLTLKLSNRGFEVSN